LVYRFVIETQVFSFPQFLQPVAGTVPLKQAKTTSMTFLSSKVYSIIHTTDKVPLINNLISSVIPAEAFEPHNSVLLKSIRH
jgi:hypothetical protein